MLTALRKGSFRSPVLQDIELALAKAARLREWISVDLFAKATNAEMISFFPEKKSGFLVRVRFFRYVFKFAPRVNASGRF